MDDIPKPRSRSGASRSRGTSHGAAAPGRSRSPRRSGGTGQSASRSTGAADGAVAAPSGEGSSAAMSPATSVASTADTAEGSVDGQTPPTTEEPTPTYTIDELAATTGVPSRTIRYYQSKGTLPAPERQGRVAVYGPEHERRLELIAELQRRGLRLDAIRDVIDEMEQGRDSLNEWLGVGDHLQAAWTDDRPTVLEEDELQRRTAAARPLFLNEAVRLGIVRRQGDTHPPSYLVPSPRMLELAVRLDLAGIDLETAMGAEAIVRKRMAKAADELVEWFTGHIGQGFGGPGDAGSVSRSVDALRPTGVEAVQLIFAQEMQRALRRFVESGRVMENPKRNRRS
ncbi:MAG: MerR family transcriptional regulator [Acidimicrobiia bacterium]|nr:MerR family transcriptional regulator [Acidimicrobiia bacterium]